jgi:hypothetical protein
MRDRRVADKVLLRHCWLADRAERGGAPKSPPTSRHAAVTDATGVVKTLESDAFGT